MRVTRIGGPTVLVRWRGWSILVDPTFDPPGRRYRFAAGTSSVKTSGPAVGADELGPIDLVLLSHDRHADNLDIAGRALLPRARYVVTTRAAARRLLRETGMPPVIGLRAGEDAVLPLIPDAGGSGDDVVLPPDAGGLSEATATGIPPLRIRATAARHGPPLSRPIVGPVVGFALSAVDAGSDTALWVTGDTVLTRAVRREARRLRPDVMIVNAGGAGFGLTGPVRFTMTGRQALQLVADAAPRVAIPAHVDGWSHFRDGSEGLRAAVDAAEPALRERVRLVRDGIPIDV